MSDHNMLVGDTTIETLDHVIDALDYLVKTSKNHKRTKGLGHLLSGVKNACEHVYMSHKQDIAALPATPKA